MEQKEYFQAHCVRTINNCSYQARTSKIRVKGYVEEFSNVNYGYYDNTYNGKTKRYYFFIASKFQYINEDNKDKKRKQNSDNEFIWRLSHGYESKNGGELTMDAQRLLNVLCVDDNEWKDKEDMNDKINELFKFLSKRLNEVFTPAETDIFLIYYRLKSEKAGISYQKMAKITERKFQEIASIIQKIKLFVKNDEEINEYKKKILK